MIIINQNLYKSIFLYRSLLRLTKKQPDILCLQEFSISKLEKLKINPLQNYFYIFPINHNNFTNAIYSKIQPIANGEIHLNTEGFSTLSIDTDKHDTVIVWADIPYNTEKIRIYNCHLAIDHIGFSQRAAMLEFIINHAQDCQKALILGDMNTTIPQGKFNRILNNLLHHNPLPVQEEIGEYYRKSEKYFFKSIAEKFGFFDLLDFSQATWRLPFVKIEVCHLKLDWVFGKGISANSAIVDSKTPLWLDHKTILVDIAQQN